MMSKPFITATLLYLNLAVALPTANGQATSLPESSTNTAASELSNFFESKVRPLLVDNCLECHAAETEASGGLLLDSKVGWQKGGDSGPALTPGSSDSSLLIRAVSYEDPHLRMPPDGKLSAEQVGILRRWIEDGAYDPRESSIPINQKSQALTLEQAAAHWAYRPLLKTELPGLDGHQVVDQLIDSQLSNHGILANTRAPRAVLIRRLTYDLHGLLPTPTEVAEFLTDDRSDAYERLVERLLSSRRFAERMARRWLDLARYAESLTLRGFTLGQAWRYRDYCIEAFHQDKPLDQFIREQVAGDLLMADDFQIQQQNQIAVTFLLLGNTNLEEQDKQQLEMDVIDEQLDTMGKAFLGQTFGCARCHDHKFDPISARDYYAMAGILKQSVALDHENVSKWIETPLPLEKNELKRYDELELQRKQLKDQISDLSKRLTPTSGQRVVALDWLAGVVVDDAGAKRVGVWTASSSVQEYVGQGYLHDNNTDRGSKTITFEPPALPPGRYEVRVSYAHGDNRSSKTQVSVFSADGESIVMLNQRQPAAVDGLWHSLGEFRFEKDGQCFVIISNAQADGHVIADAVQFLSKEITVDNREDKAAVSTDNDAAELKSRLDGLKQELNQLEKLLALRPKSMALRAAKAPTDLAIHIRGSVHQLGEPVSRGVPQLLEHCFKIQLPDDRPPTRLELANWMVAPQNPLTPRVMANRIWTWVMAEGLVRTVDQFGATGEPPVNPELLDWLAAQLVQQHWSTKQLIRTIVLSQAYQRNSSLESQTAQAARGLDPENRHFWRANRRRMDAESLRDSILQASQELSEFTGGRTFPSDLQADYDYRNDEPLRSIYLPAFRNALPEILRAFDLADSSVSVGKRNTTTVPQQALVLLNHPWIIRRCQIIVDAQLLESGYQRDSSNQLSRPEIEAMLNQLCCKLWGRQLKTSESEPLVEYVLGEHGNAPRNERLTFAVQAMIAAIDFRYIE
jgi:Protein of unknown function (DUF1553)/Protein of unknown function (DUF1549)/Planctomycete cytochrome C